MLVLNRNVGEKIVISVGGQSDCIVEIVYLGHNRVTLGFTAPPNVRILRSELIGKLKHDPITTYS